MGEPEQQFLDHLTRIDELVAKNTKAINQLNDYMKRLLEPEEPSEAEIEVSPINYQEPETFDLTTARTDEEVLLSGSQLIAVATNADLRNVTVKLNRCDAPKIKLSETNPITEKFHRLFLSNPAKDGGTLKLMASKAPLYTPVPASTPPALSKFQRRWEALVRRTEADGDAIPANSSVAVDIYTVPDGWNLHIGGAMVSCNASCIQKIVLTHSPGIMGDYRFDMEGEVMFSPLSSTVVDEGHTLTVYIYNNDNVARDFSVTVVGVEEAIE